LARGRRIGKVGKPGGFDHMADEELLEFIEAQGELVRELERKLLPAPAQRFYQALGVFVQELRWHRGLVFLAELHSRGAFVTLVVWLPL
jgi:hypothetical protein